MIYKPSVRVLATIEVVCGREYNATISLEAIADQAFRVAEARIRKMLSGQEGATVVSVRVDKVELEPQQ